jgi:hypothetical protein
MRVSAVAISNDDLYVTCADKFVVCNVWLIILWEDGAEQVSVDNKPVSIVVNYCVSSLAWYEHVLKFYIACAMYLYLLYLFRSERVMY